MKAETLFIMSPIILLVGCIVAALMMPEPKPTIPTEAEMVMMERMAKVAATAQGECK